jgi:SAM-dependent methyltransferase
MSGFNRDYVQVIYDELTRPKTNYPNKLAHYLVRRFGIQKNSSLLDVGCGRGEFLKGFIDCGLDGYAVDQSSFALKYFPNAKLKVADIENDGIPYPDNYFDVVYSKSVIEHFYYPEKLVGEMFRVLKGGGLVITLCPAWEYNYRIYFEDYTHRTPFMLESLRDIFLIHGFEDVEVEFFRQLPVIWASRGWLLPFAELTRLLSPNCLKRHSKWVRFSKEIMLLSSARKPKNYN